MKSRRCVVVVYATDFGAMAPGGISRFVELVGKHAPDDLDVAYVGVGRPDRLPRTSDVFRSALVTADPAKPLNQQFVMSLRPVLGSNEFRGATVVIHRPEYALAVPRRSPLVHVVHGGTWNAWRTGRRAFGLGYAAAEACACARAELTMTVAPNHLSRISRRLSSATHPIRVPLDPAFVHTCGGATRSSRVRRLVTASRLVPEKRIDRIVAVAARTGLPLTIFGDGPEMGRLREQARTSSATVDFRGLRDASELAAAYVDLAPGGAFLMSSTFEGYGLAAVEAMASGMPLIAVATDALHHFQQYGVHTFATVEAASRSLTDHHFSEPPIDDVIRDHAVSRVASDFWSAVQGVGPDAI